MMTYSGGTAPGAVLSAPSRPTHGTGVSLRLATPADRDTLTALHFRCWLSCYRGVFSAAYVEGGLADDIRRHWRNLFSRPADTAIVVLAHAKDAGMVGFAAASPSATSASIDHLHVEPTLHGRGLGRAILAGLAGRLAAEDCRSAHAWAASAAGARFSEHCGGVQAERTTRALGRQPAEQIRFVWNDLPRLAAHWTP